MSGNYICIYRLKNVCKIHQHFWAKIGWNLETYGLVEWSGKKTAAMALEAKVAQAEAMAAAAEAKLGHAWAVYCRACKKATRCRLFHDHYLPSLPNPPKKCTQQAKFYELRSPEGSPG